MRSRVRVPQSPPFQPPKAVVFGGFSLFPELFRPGNLFQTDRADNLLTTAKISPPVLGGELTAKKEGRTQGSYRIQSPLFRN